MSLPEVLRGGSVSPREVRQRAKAVEAWNAHVVGQQMQLYAAQQQVVNEAQLVRTIFTCLDELTEHGDAGRLRATGRLIDRAAQLGVSPVQMGRLLEENVDVKAEILHRFGNHAARAMERFACGS